MTSTTYFRQTRQLSLDGAVAVAEAARSMARQLQIQVTIAVVDAGGHLILLYREGLGVHTVDVARAKARTAASMGHPTHKLAELINDQTIALELSRHGGLTTLPGGIPLIVDGQRVGAIGTSGASAEQDISVSEAGAAALQGLTN
jgi:glc operon protein GlcG